MSYVIEVITWHWEDAFVMLVFFAQWPGMLAWNVGLKQRPEAGAANSEGRLMHINTYTPVNVIMPWVRPVSINYSTNNIKII
jgi:hypothetical protein